MKLQPHDVERIFKGFANRRRILIILHVAKNHEATVGDVALHIKLSFKATSRHLSVLAAAHILEREQRGLYMYYRLAQDIPSLAHKIIALL